MIKFELDDPAPMYAYVKFNVKASLFFQLFEFKASSGGEMDLKIWPRAQGKMGQKYQKNAKWPKISFRVPIWVPNVPLFKFACFIDCVLQMKSPFGRGGSI